MHPCSVTSPPEAPIALFAQSVASTDDSQRQPEEFCGAKVVEAMSFAFPWYAKLPLTFGLSPRIYKEVKCVPWAIVCVWGEGL